MEINSHGESIPRVRHIDDPKLMVRISRSTSLFKHDEIRLHLDLDEGRPNNRGNNKVYFLMKKTTHIEMSALRAYLQGRSAWDNSVLECMSKFTL